jgi:hypothetical protein
MGNMGRIGILGEWREDKDVLGGYDLCPGGTSDLAFHEVPGTAPPRKDRPVGHGVIRAGVRTFGSCARSFRTLRDGSLEGYVSRHFVPGYDQLSLRDKAASLPKPPYLSGIHQWDLLVLFLSVNRESRPHCVIPTSSFALPTLHP